MNHIRRKFNNSVRRFGNYVYSGLGESLTNDIKLKQLLLKLPCYALGAFVFLYLVGSVQQGRRETDFRNARLRGLDTKILRISQSYDGKPGLSFVDQAKLAEELGYKGIIKEGQSRVDLYLDEECGRLILEIDDNKLLIPESAAREYIDRKR